MAKRFRTTPSSQTALLGAVFRKKCGVILGGPGYPKFRAHDTIDLFHTVWPSLISILEPLALKCWRNGAAASSESQNKL